VLPLPELFIGETRLEKNTNPGVRSPIVDDVTRLVGETATIFQRMNERGDMLRIATTVKTTDNRRAIGTCIPAVNPDGTPNPVISAILKGDTYHGRAYVVNAWYLTAYEPLKDNTGKLVGMLYVGTQQKTVAARVRQAILQTRVGKTGYVYVLGGKGQDRGHYIISYRGERDGEDIWSSKDSQGHYIIREIVNKAVTLKPGEMTTVRYPWQNSGESAPRWKIAHLAYYAPWDWVIGTSVYEDELQTYHTVLSDGQRRMTRIMSMAGIVITLLVSLVGILVTLRIIRPVRQMTAVAEKIIEGDLDRTVHVTSYDEIGRLGRTFNLMTSQLKRSMESLRESEKNYRGIFENALEGLFQSTIEGRFLNVNPAMAHILGYDSPDDLISSLKDIGRQLYVNPDDRDKLLRIMSEYENPPVSEIQIRRKDKNKIWVSIGARLRYDDSGEPAFIEGFLMDINARKQAEEALAESKNFLDEIFNAVADPMFVKDRRHQWILINNAMCTFLGHTRSELLGKSDRDYFTGKEADAFWEKDEQVLSSGMRDIREETLTDAAGIVHTIVTHKTLYTDKKGEKFIVGIIRDITEQKRAEQERKQLEIRLTQAQKMEAIGTLAGGIAHDFNNILSVIIGYTELVMNDIMRKEYELPQTTKIHAKLEQVLKASDRARELTKQILTFSRMTETEYSPIEMKVVIKESLKMLRSVVPSTIEIRENLPVSGLVMSDPTQINQIMLNLCTNAVYAMHETGGILEVGLQAAIIDDQSDFQLLQLSPGPYMKLSIRDTGKGIPPQIMDRIFEPYFTTRELKGGTGLGLSVIHGILKSHNGTITCQSTLNEGTLFDVYLPKLEAGQAKTETLENLPLPGGNERILFVDDETVLVELYVTMLSSMGYTVDSETSSMAALERFRQNPRKFDLVITDMTMPDMTGDRLARKLIEIRHDIPIILCTGYSEHISEESAKKIGVKEFILKPLDIKTLSRTIRKVLNDY
jgi:PAS domain S-box-containing protein